MMNKYIKEALVEAKKAYKIEEVPIGAVIVKDEKIIGRGFNQVESLKDPTAHAEILAIKEATKKIGGWRLSGCEMYVTLEPCAMCAGAIVQARLDKVVYGAEDYKKGCCSSVYELLSEDKFNHRSEVVFMETKECSEILSEFFRKLRLK